MAQDASAPSAGADVAPGYRGYRNDPPVVHDEATFRHLLGIERRRADLTGRGLLLVLVSKRGAAPGRTLRLTPRDGDSIFAALGVSVREVDFVGWFRDGHVASAVLIQRGRPQTGAIVARITDTVKSELRVADGHLRVRVVTLGSRGVGIPE